MSGAEVHDRAGLQVAVRRWLEARLDRESDLGLRLTVAVVTFAAAIWVFSGILDAVLDNAMLVRMDLVAAGWVHAHVTLLGLRILARVTQLGTYGVAVTVVAVSLWLWHRRERLLLAGWLGTNAGGWMVEWALKTTVHRARPQYASQFIHRASYSFPSGHTMGAMVCYPALAMVLVWALELSKVQRRVIYGAAALVVLLVGFSRVYLGVHFPSDVAGGMAAGLAWLTACRLMMSAVRERASRRRPPPA